MYDHQSPASSFGFVPDALTHCSPRRVMFLDSESHESKKFRRASFAAQSAPGAAADEDADVSLGSGPMFDFESRESATEFIDRWLAHSEPAPMSATSPPQSPSHAAPLPGMGGIAALEAMVFAPTKKAKKFTRAEVETMMETREAQLKEEFIQTLNRLMAEQLARSQQYHQEYISRHLSKQESTYIS